MDSDAHDRVMRDTPTTDLVLEHLERAKTASNPVDRLASTAEAVNVLFNEFSAEAGHPDDGDGPGLRRLLREGIADEDQEALPGSEEVHRLVLECPWIETDRRVGPDEDPAKAHKAFVRQWHRWHETSNNRNRKEALARLAGILWVVRSNRSHGRKSVVPDRNRHVAALTADVPDTIIATFAGPMTWPR